MYLIILLYIYSRNTSNSLQFVQCQEGQCLQPNQLCCSSLLARNVQAQSSDVALHFRSTVSATSKVTNVTGSSVLRTIAAVSGCRPTTSSSFLAQSYFLYSAAEQSLKDLERHYRCFFVEKSMSRSSLRQISERQLFSK